MSSTQCFTNESIVLSVGAIGDLCSGRGQCINSQCVCDPYWIGRSDLISLEGQACQKFMWAFASFMHFKLFIQALPALRYQFQQYQRRRRTNKRNACGTFPAIAVLELFAVPALCAIFAVRAATDLNFGVDLSISVSFGVVFSLYLFAIAYMETTLFQHMVLGTADMGGRTEMVKVVRLDSMLAYFGTLFYSTIYCVSLIAPVFLSLGPTPARIGIMVMRNVGTLLYFGFYTIHHSILKSRVLAMMSSSKSSDRLNRALQKIDASIHMARKRVVILGVVITLFTVCPPLFSFQYISWSFMLGIACGGNHILMQIASGKHDDSDTEHQISSGQNKGNGEGGIVPVASDDASKIAYMSSSNVHSGEV